MGEIPPARSYLLRHVVASPSIIISRVAVLELVRLYEEWKKPERARAWKIKLAMCNLPDDVFVHQ
jgi:hypothetical protein